jgi:preprotein translocase subunit SecA
VAAREAEIERRGQELEQRERSVAIRERRLSDVEAAGGELDGWQPPKLGRNEPCWCGSGKKFKYCHGRTTQ